MLATRSFSGPPPACNAPGRSSRSRKVHPPERLRHRAPPVPPPSSRSVCPGRTRPLSSRSSLTSRIRNFACRSSPALYQREHDLDRPERRRLKSARSARTSADSAGNTDRLQPCGFRSGTCLLLRACRKVHCPDRQRPPVQSSTARLYAAKCSSSAAVPRQVQVLRPVQPHPSPPQSYTGHLLRNSCSPGAT